MLLSLWQTSLRHMTPHKSTGALKDGWTHDADYRRCYQTEDDIKTILALLALGRESRLVDIGCGNGAFAIAAAQQHPGCRVWAFDALDSAVAECKARAGGLPQIQVEKAWAHSLLLADASADRALFRSVLHHIAEPQPVYAEIGRVLEPGGRLVLQTPCNFWEPEFACVLSEVMMLVDDSHRRSYYRPTEIAEGLERAGFSTGKPECWPYPFSFIDEKQARFIQEHQATEKLRLRPIGSGKWHIEGYWTRIVAQKVPHL
jgi:SAM-dependent methyltransferase